MKSHSFLLQSRGPGHRDRPRQQIVLTLSFPFGRYGRRLQALGLPEMATLLTRKKTEGATSLNVDVAFASDSIPAAAFVAATLYLAALLGPAQQHLTSFNRLKCRYLLD